MKAPKKRAIYAPDDGHDWEPIGHAISRLWSKGVPPRLECKEGTFILKSYGGYVWKRKLTAEEQEKEDAG